MEVDFDKQVNTILRNLAKTDSFVESMPESHPDADQLSAFAENLLPAKARLRTVEHLADCQKCRKILTNLAIMNFEVQSETIPQETVAPVSGMAAIPWYQRIFNFPQLAYTMGALALVFTGLIGYLILQNSEPELAQVEKSPENIVVGNSNTESRLNEMQSANAAANVPLPAANTAANSAPKPLSDGAADKPGEPLATPAVARGSSETEVAGSAAEKSNNETKISEDSPKEEILSKKTTAPPPAQVAADQPAGEVTGNNIARQQQQELPVQNRSQNNIMMPDGNQRNAPIQSSPRKIEQQRAESDERVDTEKDKRREVKAEPTKNVGGKNFRNENGVWIDTSYSGGKTKNIRRTSGDYRKLDSALQNIGNSLSGTVIVVWNGKNYKIQ